MRDVAQLLQTVSPAAAVIISVAVMLFLGFLMTRLTQLLHLPNVTAYIVTGILIGPFCLDLIPDSVVAGMDFLSDIALAFIAFSTGQFFRFSVLKRNGPGVLIITVAEACLASACIFALCFWALHLPLDFSAVLAALAAATAPASTMMTIRQTGARGDFVDTLLQVVALDDIVGLLAYSVAIAVAGGAHTGGSFRLATVLAPFAVNVGVLALGAVFGLVLKLLIHNHATDNRLIIALAMLFAFCGVCSLLDISPLLGCMSMGMVYINVSDSDTLFKQLNYFNPPILLLFFVRSGISFDLNALLRPSGALGGVSLLVIGVLYFFVRILGKYGGAFLGCLVTGREKKVRNTLGLALIPQAGVAIGLAALGARTLGGETGNALNTIILASSVLYELVGPGCAKLSLYLSGSYSTRLEELVDVPELTEDGQQKTSVELLIDRIQEIQKQIPEHVISEDEQEFTRAAEELYESYTARRRNRPGRR